MADDDRQPPQAYDTVAPAGVGATTSNQMSPRAIQQILDTGDQSLIDQTFNQIVDAGDYDALGLFLDRLPPITDLGMPLQASSPAGVGSPGSQSYRSIQTTLESSGGRTPASPPSVPLAAGARTPAGARTAAGAGGDGNGHRGPRTRGGGRGAGRGGGGAGGAGGAGGGVGGGGRRGGGGGRRGRRTPTSPLTPLTPASNATTPRGSWSPGRQPRTLRQADLQRRLRMMLQDQEQLAQGREIANVTMTNSIVTSYKQGGAPSVQTSLARVSP